MSDSLERQLARDLQTLGDMIHDDSFYEELYRGLAGVNWTLDGEHLSLSWKRAEEVVNALRTHHGFDPMVLAQTGGEGEVTDRVAGARGATGWTAKPLDTSQGNPAHLTSRHDAPSQG